MRVECEYRGERNGEPYYFVATLNANRKVTWTSYGCTLTFSLFNALGYRAEHTTEINHGSPDQLLALFAGDGALQLLRTSRKHPGKRRWPLGLRPKVLDLMGVYYLDENPGAPHDYVGVMRAWQEYLATGWVAVSSSYEEGADVEGRGPVVV